MAHFNKAKRSLRFLVSVRVASDPRVGMFSLFCIFYYFIFFCYETMSNCSKNLLKNNCDEEHGYTITWVPELFMVGPII